MRRAPVMPVPGRGRFVRQPIYVRDVCEIISSCIAGDRHIGQTYNVTGRERIAYVDILETIREAQGLRTPIVPIPYALFWLLLKSYAVFDRNPPFTTDQLDALVAGDEFDSHPWWDIFGVPGTPFRDAIVETFQDPRFSRYVLDL
jgi:uncharacterized protein YbjT (DUF2867 family)